MFEKLMAWLKRVFGGKKETTMVATLSPESPALAVVETPAAVTIVPRQERRNKKPLRARRGSDALGRRLLRRWEARELDTCFTA